MRFNAFSKVLQLKSINHYIIKLLKKLNNTSYMQAISGSRLPLQYNEIIWRNPFKLM